MNTSVDFFEEPEEFNYVALVCSLLILVGVGGNSLVCLAIAFEKRLQNTTNYFLFSLAVVDLLVSLLVMPLCIHQEFHMGRVDTGFGLCLFLVYSDVLLCSASIVHMSVIALDRYLGISRPLRMRAATKSAVLAKITTVWVIAVAISCPIAILALLDNTNIYSLQGECAITNSYYQILGSVVAFYIPLFIMIIAYHKTTYLLNKQAVLCQRRDDRGLRRTMTRSKRKRKTDEINSEIMAKFTYVGDQCERGWPQPRCEADESDLATFRNMVKERTVNLLKIVRKTSAQEGCEDTRIEVASEQKATRVLGLVFAVFFVCWFPFFSTNTILAFCNLSDGCTWFHPSPHLVALFAWLGYVSSVANPVIYTVFNNQFRSAFYKILRCRMSSESDSRRGTLSRRRMPSCGTNHTTTPTTPRIHSAQSRLNGRLRSSGELETDLRSAMLDQRL